MRNWGTENANCINENKSLRALLTLPGWLLYFNINESQCATYWQVLLANWLNGFFFTKYLWNEIHPEEESLCTESWLCTGEQVTQPDFFTYDSTVNKTNLFRGGHPGILNLPHKWSRNWVFCHVWVGLSKADLSSGKKSTQNAVSIKPTNFIPQPVGIF